MKLPFGFNIGVCGPREGQQEQYVEIKGENWGSIRGRLRWFFGRRWTLLLVRKE